LHVIEISIEWARTEDGARDWGRFQLQGDLVFGLKVTNVDAAITTVEDGRKSRIDKVFYVCFL